MNRYLKTLVAALMVALPLSMVSNAALAAKKPVPKTNSARATAEHNRKVEADKAKRTAKANAEKSKKAAAKAKKP